MTTEIERELCQICAQRDRMVKGQMRRQDQHILPRLRSGQHSLQE